MNDAGCPMCAEIGAHCGRHDETGAFDVSDTPECDRCAQSAGLCRRHAHGILPQLAQPFWYRQAHSGLWTDEKENAVKDAATLKAERRERMKAKRRAELKALMSDLGHLPPAA